MSKGWFAPPRHQPAAAARGTVDRAAQEAAQLSPWICAAGFVGVWGCLLVFRRGFPETLKWSLIGFSYLLHVVGVVIAGRHRRAARLAWIGLVANTACLLLPIALVGLVTVAMMVFGLGDDFRP